MTFMSDDCVFESIAGKDACGTRHVGRERVREAFAGVFAAFPDVRFGSVRHFVSGDRGLSEWLFTGTAADGRKVEVNGCDVFTFRHGKIAVKSSFFKHRKFQDMEDLEAQLAAWHIEVNTKTPSRATGVIPETRRREELARLRPIKVFPETLALRIPIFVGPTAEVMFEGVPYSMPPEATHVAGTLFLFEDRVRIVAGRFECEHRRRRKGTWRRPS